MKQVKYFCDKCKSEFNKDSIVQIVAQRKCGANDTRKNTIELCTKCYSKLDKLYEDFIEEEDGYIPNIEKAVSTDELKTGPWSGNEIAIWFEMQDEHKPVEEIAARLHRSVEDIKRGIPLSADHVHLGDEIDERRKENKYDVSGMIALAKAGWSAEKIADEHGITVYEVMEVLAKNMKD